MIIVTGIGWITGKEYGCVRLESRVEYTGIKELYDHLRDETVLPFHVKQFGRFDTVSQVTCCAVALAMHDAGMPRVQGARLDVGVLGTNSTGCLKTNIDFFKDYVESGRVLARGNLFIYTLPSSSLAEAAICFGLCGPLLYMMVPAEGFSQLLEMAGSMIVRGETTNMVVIRNGEEEGICFVLKQKDRCFKGRHWTLKEAELITRRNSATDAMIEQFSEAVS